MNVTFARGKQYSLKCSLIGKVYVKKFKYLKPEFFTETDVHEKIYSACYENHLSLKTIYLIIHFFTCSAIFFLTFSIPRDEDRGPDAFHLYGNKAHILETFELDVKERIS